MIYQDYNTEIDWPGVAAQLDSAGSAFLPGLLSGAACRELAGLYSDALRFRSRVVMDRHGFGRGEYQYFAYPLPPLVGKLRADLYAHLSPIANAWSLRLGGQEHYRPTLAEFLANCHAAGQVKPTPLLLQ